MEKYNKKPKIPSQYETYISVIGQALKLNDFKNSCMKTSNGVMELCRN